MKLRTLASMISTSNDYSLLKWPLILLSVLITLLTFFLLLSFQSNSWFIYESFDVDEKTTRLNETMKYTRSLEYGSFGLWALCIEHPNDMDMKCDTWVKQTRPQYFNVIMVLASWALLLTNLAIFPSWASAILILYNTKNRYIRYIVVFLWTVLCLSLIFTCLLVAIMLLIGLTKFYSPGTYIIEHKYISFHSGPGIISILIATILAILSLILLIISLIWKKFIEMRLIDEEKELYRQLAEENYAPGWHKVIRVPRTTTDDSDPPPYHPYYDRTDS